MTVAVTFARLAAPSFKTLAINGLGRPQRGQRPTCRVVVAVDDKGRQWVHHKIFGSGEGEKAVKLAERVQAAGCIDPKHWRQTGKGEY